MLNLLLFFVLVGGCFAGNIVGLDVFFLTSWFYIGGTMDSESWLTRFNNSGSSGGNVTHKELSPKALNGGSGESPLGRPNPGNGKSLIGRVGGVADTDGGATVLVNRYQPVYHCNALLDQQDLN